MIKHTTLNILLLILVSSSLLNAQKLKYKDIYGLLSTKQYDQAEPFLKFYLTENTDNPNAYLFMGLIYQEKSSSVDILLQTDKSILQMDSAVLFLSKAAQGMTEKEIKKNKEYYTAYNRRDLRTGEFGVKLSDVQLDLENRISTIHERIDKVKMIKHYFSNAESLYKGSSDLFKEIQRPYPGELELYLRADEGMIEKIKALSLRFDSCSKMFEHYKVSLSNLGKTRYNQSWNLQEISDFKKDGTSPVDFYTDDLKIWDYKKFAAKSLEVIEKEVGPTLNDLVTYDIEINKLRQRLETDSVSVKSDLVKLIDRLLDNQLKKFDTDPMPLSVFALKIADLDYKSVMIENKPAMKSSDLTARLAAVKSESNYLNRVDSVASRLLSRTLDNDILNYQKFINNTFSKGDIFKSYLRSIKDYSGREKVKKLAEISLYTEALKWLIINKDSIPLVSEGANARYRIIQVENNKYTVGATFAESVSGSGYFYNITPSRIPTIQATFPLDSSFLNDKVRNSLKSLVTSDAAEQIYFVTIFGTETTTGKHTATIAKIYKSDGLSWNSNVLLDFVPFKIAMVPETGGLIIKSETEEIFVSIDKNGKLIPK